MNSASRGWNPPAASAPINSGDNAWLLVSSALVLMMTAPGLILFYGGLVRSKNVLSTMGHSLMLMAIISVLWMIYGYSMAFGKGNAFWEIRFNISFSMASAARQTLITANGPATKFHVVSDDVRHHHSCSDQRRDGRTNQIQSVSDIYGLMGNGGLFSTMPYGLGNRRIVNWALGGQYPFWILRAARWCMSVPECPLWFAR